MVLSEGERGRKYRTPGEFFYIQIFFSLFFIFERGEFFFSRGGTENFLFLKKEGSALDTLKTTTTHGRVILMHYQRPLSHFR